MNLGIIPARYASTRFPGKPLVEIQGKSMIQRVYEAAQSAHLLDEVIVATDDSRIADHVESFNGKVVLTGTEHPSGTDRCWEAYLKWQGKSGKSANYIINVQGDEPFLNPIQIDELASVLTGEVELATQMIRVHSAELLHSLGEAKIVLDTAGNVLLFSRQAIPYLKNIPPDQWHLHHPYYRHIGMYAYRVDVLEKITQLAPSPLEKAESLEQLRWLEAGYRIKMVETTYDSPCIDTPEDLKRVLGSL
ncbi:MAG: 3-deoxy-manno-octulosonate cytidylyltransferase [Siphonobacter sp.]